MKNKYAGMLLVLLVWALVPAEAQLFKPFTSLRVIKTERFDIIFPEESESSARLLASYADRVYEHLSSLLGIEIAGRIPVTFAPHTDSFNAYYQSVPNPHIVLYDAPMDLEWTSFADSLESLFLHELTHAVSWSARDDSLRWLHTIFGNWVSPALLYAPLFMVEGVTVSFESLSGFGRANDPLIKQKLRQAIHEGKFLTPFQASGVYDLPVQQSSWYEYGGLFSAWLQRTYGMEKYAGLWQAMGKGIGISFMPYSSGYYRAFRNVYDVDFMDAWSAFSDSLALDGLEENNDELFPEERRFFSERRHTISALSARGSLVYVLYGSEGKIRVYDTLTGKTRVFNAGPLTSNDLDVSVDGTTLLVSGYQLIGDQYRAIVTEHRTDSGRGTGRTIHGLFKARYFRDGVIGIRGEQHNTCVVYEDFSGRSEVLFRGNEKLVFSGPQALDDERIVFIAAREGIRELLLYNYATGELFRVENADSNDTDGNETDGNAVDYWRYMRGLGVSDGKLFFSQNADDRMYKLACIDLETMKAVYSGRDFSGGVFYPVAVDNDIYYRAAFFSGDGFLRFPETTASLSGVQSGIRLVEVNRSANLLCDANLLCEEYGLAGAVAGASTGAAAEDWPELPGGESKPYFSILYMNPFRFWLPLPLIRANTSSFDNFKISLDGGGIFSLMSDPTDRHFISLMAYADIAYRMAMIDTFSWQTTVPGFPLTLAFSDKVIEGSRYNAFEDGDAPEGSGAYRDTRVDLSGGFSWRPRQWYYGFSLGGSYSRTAENDGGETAYTWAETESNFSLFTSATISSIQRRQHELFGSGLYLRLKGASVLDSFEPRVEGMFRASAETRFPVRLTLYGAYDSLGLNLQGVSRTYGRPIFTDVASVEYPNPAGLKLSWLAGGEASLGLFSFEIQNNLSHLYFNRVFGSLSLRTAFYDGKGLTGAEGTSAGRIAVGQFAIGDLRLAQSLVLRVGLVSSILPIKSAPIFVEPNLAVSWKFSNTITGRGSPWSYGVALNLRY